MQFMATQYEEKMRTVTNNTKNQKIINKQNIWRYQTVFKIEPVSIQLDKTSNNKDLQSTQHFNSVLI